MKKPNSSHTRVRRQATKPTPRHEATERQSAPPPEPTPDPEPEPEPEPVRALVAEDSALQAKRERRAHALEEWLKPHA